MSISCIHVRKVRNTAKKNASKNSVSETCHTSCVAAERRCVSSSPSQQVLKTHFMSKDARNNRMDTAPILLVSSLNRTIVKYCSPASSLTTGVMSGWGAYVYIYSVA